MDLAKK